MSIKLTHYTKSIESICKIVDNGFAYMPNRRNLIELLIPNHDFSAREPQEFGMISFTEHSVESAKEVRKEFGNYGIILKNEWAESHKIQKVNYLAEHGPVFDAYSNLFQKAYKELSLAIKRRSPGDKMAYTNKEMAAVYGGVIYKDLLQVYEYMEPIENSCQQEWRIVHPYPYYGYEKTKEERIKNVSPPKGWTQYLNVLKINRKDVMGFACPLSDKPKMQALLPKKYKYKLIETF